MRCSFDIFTAIGRENTRRYGLFGMYVDERVMKYVYYDTVNGLKQKFTKILGK